jgi:hypothetical protein
VILNARIDNGYRPEIYVVGEKRKFQLFCQYPEIEKGISEQSPKVSNLMIVEIIRKICF